MSIDLDDIERRMEGAVATLKTDLGGLRTGRASASLLEPIMVEAYGQQMPIAQVGTISVPEPRMLSVQVWDKGQVALVEKAIRESGLGLNPMADGQLVRTLTRIYNSGANISAFTFFIITKHISYYHKFFKIRQIK